MLDLTYDEGAAGTDASDDASVRRNVPVVHFGVGTGELLKEMHSVGADVVGVDYRVPLDEANRRLGGLVPVQGNVDPALLAAPWPVLEAHVLDVLERGRTAPSHVLNLGHGVPPMTDPNVLTRLVAFVPEVTAVSTDGAAGTDGVPEAPVIAPPAS